MNQRSPGVCLDIWDGGGVAVVMFVGEQKGKIRVVSARGREMQIPESRVANVSGTTLDPKGERVGLGKRLRELEKEIHEQAGSVDLRSLWEILADEGGEYSLDELADLSLATRDGNARSAILRSLIAEQLYFSRKRMSFIPRTREELGESVRRRRREEENEQRRQSFVDVVKRYREERPEGPPVWQPGSERFVSLLEDFAIHGLDSKRQKDGQALVRDLGETEGDPVERAFGILVDLGHFRRDENLLLYRYGISRKFSPEVIADAERRRDGGVLTSDDRRDLSELECFAIDGVATTEIDDAISMESLPGGAVRFGIHIADPTPYVEPGGVLDSAALDRATTLYLPEERILMLPPAISEGVASLAVGETRTTLTFFVDIDGTGEIVKTEIVPSLVKLRARLTYEALDELIAAGGGVPRLDENLEDFSPTMPPEPVIPGGLSIEVAERWAHGGRLLRAVLERRVAAGALTLKGPDTEIRVEDGEVTIRRFEPWTPAWLLVSEAMVLANRVAAECLRAAGVPAIYRQQARPAKPITAPRGYDPALVAAARRQVRPATVSLTPAVHAGLGLPAYVQCTSPLRRYQDLVCHRQLRAAITGDAPALNAEELWKVAATVDAAERTGRVIERSNKEYWILRHLESLPPDTVLDAVITRAEDRRTLIELSSLVFVTQLSPRPGHQPGRRIRVVVNTVAPRAGRLSVRELAG